MYLGVSWTFAFALVIDKGLDFWPALETSRKVVGKHWWMMLALLILCALLNLLGLLACVIGLFISVPVIFTATMYAYEDVFGERPKQIS